jgi:hypothetical protein
MAAVAQTADEPERGGVEASALPVHAHLHLRQDEDDAQVNSTILYPFFSGTVDDLRNVKCFYIYFFGVKAMKSSIFFLSDDFSLILLFFDNFFSSYL